MRIKLIPIGNSIGIRLPKSVIQSCGFESEVELTVQNKTVVLSAPREGRTAWKELFQESLKEQPMADGGEWEW